MDTTKVIFSDFMAILNIGDYFREQTVNKGHLLYAAGHVDSVKEEISCESFIFGACLPQTSINKEPYCLKLQLSNNREITGGTCSCKVGLGGKCKHLAALATFVNESRSCSKTDQRQAWGIPVVKSGYSKGKKLEEMFPPTNVASQCFRSVPLSSISHRLPVTCPFLTIIDAEYRTEEEKDCREVLSHIIDAICEQEIDETLTSLMKNATLSPYLSYESSLKDGKILLTRKKYALPEDQLDFFNSEILKDFHSIKEIAKSTVSQHKSETWHKVRSVRISASVCHQIWTRKANHDNLAERILRKSFKGNKCTFYGQKLENAARSSFSYHHGVKVTNLGVIICEKYPWLCCSPDGVYMIGNHFYLIEIKCPFSRKGLKLVDRDNNQSFVPYIYYDGHDFKPKSSHQYYSQIQLSLYILNLKMCTLYVYSSVDKLAVPVHRDDGFISELIVVLESFYYLYFLPKICKL